MLTIRNYKKIKNKYFGEWQIGKMEEMRECYALQIWNVNSRKSVTMIILREGELSTEWHEMTYQISMIEDGAGTNGIIEDIVYRNTLEDMELFGEALVHYLNTI